MLNGPVDYASIDPAVVDRMLTRGQRALPESAFVFASPVAARWPHQTPIPAASIFRKAPPRPSFVSPA
jgi:hypothetical protein